MIRDMDDKSFIAYTCLDTVSQQDICYARQNGLHVLLINSLEEGGEEIVSNQPLGCLTMCIATKEPTVQV